MEKKTYTKIDEYIDDFQPDIKEKLVEIYKIIKAAAPDATEKISWGMPTFYYFGNLVHFAANKVHVGFYPGDSGVEHFKDELTEYTCSKGAIRFLYSKPLPKQLITKIVKFRVKEQKQNNK